jgi:hypothetical protein
MEKKVMIDLSQHRRLDSNMFFLIFGLMIILMTFGYKLYIADIENNNLTPIPDSHPIDFQMPLPKLLGTPVIDNVTVQEDLSTPFDYVAWNNDTQILFYSNDQIMETVFNITFGVSDPDGLKSLNTSTAWGDGINKSLSGELSYIYNFTYNITRDEISNGNITLTVVDSLDNSNTQVIHVEEDNLAPTEFAIELDFVLVYDECGVINTTTTDNISGLYTVSVTINALQSNQSSGVSAYCSLLNGVQAINAIAYDYVANSREADNSGQIYIQAVIEEVTTTKVVDNFDPLDFAEDIFDQASIPLFQITLASISFVLIWRLTKRK